MSRGYSKMYNRKLNAVSQTSIQFDKLFHENSNRPSAAKSAGTVGKWGVISCTSLRSTNFNGRRDEVLSNKRMRMDYSNRNTSHPAQSKDPFTFDTDGDGLQNKLLAGSGASPVKPMPKPKKFFKSRNIDIVPQEEIRLNASVYMGSNRSSEVNYGSHGGKKYGKGSYSSRVQQCNTSSSSQSSSAGSKKFFTSTAMKNSGSVAAGESVGEQLEAMNLSSPTKTTAPLREENKPPIVLRIFKGTAQLVNEIKDQSSAHQPPSKSVSENSVSLRNTRRRHVESVDTWTVTTNENGKVSITASPKKSSKVGKDASVVRSHSTSEHVIVEKTPEPQNTEKSQENVHPEQQVICEQEEAKQEDESVHSVYEGMQTMHDEKENISGEGIISDVEIPPLSYPAVPKTKTLALMVPEVPVPEVSEMPVPEVPEVPVLEVPEVPSHLPEETEATIMAVPDLSISSDLDREDQEKLLKAQELLSSTYVDFSATTEKLLMAGPKEPAKTILDHDWFSDSEDSNSIADQINTIASSQGECEADVQVKTVEPDEKVGDVESVVASDTQGQAECEHSSSSSSSNAVVTERTSSPATKKGSIFKSRSLLSDGSKKRLALYKHKWVDDKDGTGAGTQPSTAVSDTLSSSQPSCGTSTYSDLEEEFEPAKLTRVVTWPTGNSDLDDQAEAITSVKCNRKAKGFYTVVRNVKKAHQIQESGEFQEFNDDVEYILDALQDNNPIGTRCLSAITLASKCMAPAFRMHVRAHGTVAKFFRALHDATKDQSLGLCTATVMFVLSQDRLNMDLDRHSLELMLNLLESDASHRNALDDCGMSSTQLHKNKQKVRELCAEIQSQGHAKHVNLDNITVGQLAMETLLSLTSRRAGEWFKEELRELGGLEHIVKTVCDCCRQVDDYIVEWTEPLLDKLRKVDRCLRVLENVTNQNEENQLYLLKYGDGMLIDTLIKLYRHCDAEIPLYPVTNLGDKVSAGAVIREVLLTTLKVLINLTHDFNNESYGSTLVGERVGIVDASLHVLLQVPNYVPDEKKFDLLVLALILLINLVEHSKANRKLLYEAKAPADPESIFLQDEKSAVEALISLFYQQEELARVEEVKTDAILDGKKDTEVPEAESAQPKSHEEFIEETVAKLLQKAGRNMEHTLIGAYVGLLLGYLIMDNKEYELQVRQCLPEKNFKLMVMVLQKVYNFMHLTASAVGSSRGIAQTERVINYLEQSDMRAAAHELAIMDVVNVTQEQSSIMSVLDDSIS
ncbi:protein wings apart-like [Periplaneta americana]|uniref:protein wings apart-like n=1 Tax=Periplaneta americana TaxID=6978 RepID=UPI0037E84598